MMLISMILFLLPSLHSSLHYDAALRQYTQGRAAEGNSSMLFQIHKHGSLGARSVCSSLHVTLFNLCSDHVILKVAYVTYRVSPLLKEHKSNDLALMGLESLF